MSSKQEGGEQIFTNSPYLGLKVLYLKSSKIIAATRKVQNSNVIESWHLHLRTQFFQFLIKKYILLQKHMCALRKLENKINKNKKKHCIPPTGNHL